jgi:hypothetical protein
VRPTTLARLALAGSRTDRLRVALTVVSSALASLVLLAAATVAAVPELGRSDEGSGAWNNYSSELIAQPGLRPGVVLTLLLLAVPVLVLAGHSVRFGSPARDRRLAAVRLAGGTRRQAVLLAAFETGLSALLGSVVGFGAYLSLRQALHRPGPDGHLPLPTDVLPPAWGVALVLAIVPVLASVAAAVLLRHVVITPLGVVRRTRDKQPSVLPGVLILGGIFAPIVIRPAGEWILRQLSGHGLTPDWFLPGIALIILAAIVGVILGTGWITYTTGRVLHRYGRRPGALLAARQLMADPWSGSRMLAALLAALIIGSGVYTYRTSVVTEIAADEQAWRQLGEVGSQDNAFYMNTIDLINVAVDVGIVLAAAGIMVALAEGIVTRRRTYAALVATGVPRRTLGEAIMWQTLGPLVPATLVALIVGTGLVRSMGSTATAEVGNCAGENCEPGSPNWHNATVTLNVPIPYADLVLLGAGAAVVMALVAGVGLLFLRMSTDLEEIRMG